MSSDLISFDGKYYKYHSGKKEEQRFLIDEYESNFLADLVASYLFDKSKPFLNPKTYQGMYRDDVLVVFKGKESVKQIKDGLEEFQKRMNRAAGNQQLQVNK